MKGNIKVVVSTKKLRYELNLRRNITIIQGDSATGKTTLIQIINDYLSSRTGPGTDVICKKKCAVLSGDLESVLIRLERLSDTIVFANEQEHFLYPKRFAAAVLKSDCYFVFITRDDLHTLPYSVNEIYCLKNSGYYQNTRQVYNSLHQIYPESQVHDMIAPTMILTEDSVGYQMFHAICAENKISCASAAGKSNIASYLLSNKSDRIFAIVDGAAFGADIKSVTHALTINTRSYIWTPESFECLILQSGIFHEETLQKILNSPSEYIESDNFSSWERFFTRLLE